MQVFPCYSLAGYQTMTSNFIIIISMHRLSQLYHNEIGNINYIIDSTDTSPFQTLLHPLWRRTNFYIFQYTTREAAAQIMSLNADFHHISSLGSIILINLDFWPLWLIASKNSYFTNQAKDTKAITSIGCQLKFQNHIIQAKNLCNCYTNWSVLWQNINAIQLLFRHIGSVQLQLIGRTQHTVGWYATKLALGYFLACWQLSTYHCYRNNIILMNILSTSNNLYRLSSTYIHGGNKHMIRIWMRNDIFYLAGNNLFQSFIGTNNIFHRNPGHSQLISQFLGGLCEIYIIMKPFYRYLHFLNPPYYQNCFKNLKSLS